ncbi:rCG63732 [Rattus norvegicus]|uniref:RCG63732 n=1 Tax=Rattus norvegicus TaxID=10116 RepID=A6I8A5_RAT|nr:rCG63732 [Rattus norvegicus]
MCGMHSTIMLYMYVFVGMKSAINSHIQKYNTKCIALKDSQISLSIRKGYMN